MAVVTFDPLVFLERYPRFSQNGVPLLTDAQLQEAFDVACLMVDNTDASPVPYDPERNVNTRATLLNLLVCHLASLALWPAGQSGPAQSVTEGSVSVSFALPQTMGQAYFSQTTCGQTFWQLARSFLVGGRYFAVRDYHPWG